MAIKHARRPEWRRIHIAVIGAITSSLISIVGTSPATAATMSSTSTTASACTDIEIIVARGSLETGSTGATLTPIAEGIARESPASSTIYGVPYPAAVLTIDSSSSGTTMLADRVKARSQACPSMTFVLLGYSQGSIVIDDALTGRPFGLFPPEIPARLQSRIGAIMLFANGYYRAGMPYDRGTAVTENPRIGSFLPTPEAELQPFADRLADFCNANDPVCQAVPKGGFDGHVQYAKYDRSAIGFVLRTLAAQKHP